MVGTHKDREHALVLGASMAGLLTARVLSEHFERVTLVERDVLPRDGDHRRGVPQGRHVHALLPQGSRILEELFPGIVADLSSAGAPLLDNLARLHFRVLGNLLSRQASQLEPAAVQASRPFLEARVRSRVRNLPNVRILDGHDILELVGSPHKDRITGVRVVAREESAHVQRVICADLVVDAMGRAGRTPAWLERLGYPRPEEQRIQVDVSYTSLPVRLRPESVGADLLLIGPQPGRLTGMGLFAYEDDTWMFTVMGYGDAHPEPNWDSMLAVADRIAPPWAAAALADAQQLGEIRVHHYPASVRRRYEGLARFPEGLLVTGDALCTFNPIYGQGMTVAAEEALALREALAHGDHALQRRFFRAAARHVDVAWDLSVGSDLALPEVAGQRSLQVRGINAYIGRLLGVAQHDPVVATQFLRVIGFLDSPSTLFHPRVLGRVLRGARRATWATLATGEHTPSAGAETGGDTTGVGTQSGLPLASPGPLRERATMKAFDGDEAAG